MTFEKLPTNPLSRIVVSIRQAIPKETIDRSSFFSHCAPMVVRCHVGRSLPTMCCMSHESPKQPFDDAWTITDSKDGTMLRSCRRNRLDRLFSGKMEGANGLPAKPVLCKRNMATPSPIHLLVLRACA